MYLIKERKIGYTGIQAMYIADIGTRLLASIDAYPFGFLLEFEPKIKCQELDITDFFNKYEDKTYNLDFRIPILERNMPFSTDYRSKEEIIKCKEENESKSKDENNHEE